MILAIGDSTGGGDATRTHPHAEWRDLTNEPLLYAPQIGVPPERLRANLRAILGVFGKRCGHCMKAGNLFADIPADIADESFKPLVGTSSLRLERIVSAGRSAPRDQWFDQERDEWVVLLAGRAGLRFEGEPEVLVLRPGDYVHIAAHRRHRVEWTEEKTVWLALHYEDR